MRLIDADALLDKIYEQQNYMKSSYPKQRLVVSDVICMIKIANSVDAEPVRHGHWRLDEVGNAFYSALCSCCGKYSYQAIGWGGNVTLPYCSWCGAKMDEVSE